MSIYNVACIMLIISTVFLCVQQYEYNKQMLFVSIVNIVTIES